LSEEIYGASRNSITVVNIGRYDFENKNLIQD
jgi:hypothetical protein